MRGLLTAFLWFALLWPAWTQTGAGKLEAVQFYRKWKKLYLRHGPGAGEGYILVGSDSRGGGQAPGTFSISEGHGYGMLLTVAMARFDPQARGDFDRLYRFYLHHPSPQSPRLMAWNQTHHDQVPVSSASDGDLDIAYALLWAGQIWGDPYGAQGRAMLPEILRRNVNPKTQLVGLGSFIHPDEPEYYFGVRTSDIMPGHFRAFARASHDRRWDTVLNNSYRLLASLQRQHSPEAGLWPDFVIVRPGQAPKLVPPDYLEGKDDACYGYNAIARITITQTHPAASFGMAETQAPFTPAPPDPHVAARADALCDDIADPGLRAALSALAANILTASAQRKANR